MLLTLSKILCRSNYILILVMLNLATSVPLKSRNCSPNENDQQSFSVSPKIVEIQLPLKISSKEDVVAWSRYVKSLIGSKNNSTSSTSKNVQSIDRQHEKRIFLADNAGIGSNEMRKKMFFGEKQRLNYQKVEEPLVQNANDMVIAYPLPIGRMQDPQNSFDLSASGISDTNDQQLYLGHYDNFNIKNAFQQSDHHIFDSTDMLSQPPSGTYLPVFLETNDVTAYQNVIDKNESAFEPVKLQSTNSLNLHTKAFNDALERVSSTNDGLVKKNLSRIGEPLLTFPFQAIITIAGEVPAAATMSEVQPVRDYFTLPVRDPVDEFPPYFEKNYTLTNESGQVNVILDDFLREKETGKRKMVKENVREQETQEEVRQQDIVVKEQKTKSDKRKNDARQQNLKKRQSSVLGDLLRMLGILKKLPTNATDVSVAAPILSILKGTNPQKIQVAFAETLPNRARRNESLQAQQINDEDEEEEEEEEEGGSIQTLLELLPVAAPILEDLSDPESDVDLVEVLQGAIPLLEGLSDPEDEDSIDFPGVLVPLSQRLSEGPDGQGSDSGAILGPLIQLIAPLIGPIVGPLVGPLSRVSSGPGGKQGSASLITAVAGPLSQPGPNGQSVLSSLIAGITAKLSKELAASAGDSDVKSLVSALVAGVLAGSSAGSSGASKGHKDTYYAPTTYNSYGSYGHAYVPYKPNVIVDALKEIAGAFLKLSATASSSSAGLSGASSSSSAGLSASSSESKKPYKYDPPLYGPHIHSTYEGPPPKPSYAATNVPYTMFIRKQIQEQITRR